MFWQKKTLEKWEKNNPYRNLTFGVGMKPGTRLWNQGPRKPRPWLKFLPIGWDISTLHGHSLWIDFLLVSVKFLRKKKEFWKRSNPILFINVILHRRRKLFNIVVSEKQSQQNKLQYLEEGIEKCKYPHAFTYTCMHPNTRMHMLLNVHTPMPACTHTCKVQAWNLHPDMKIIKIKASDLYEKSNKYMYVILL